MSGSPVSVELTQKIQIQKHAAVTSNFQIYGKPVLAQIARNPGVTLCGPCIIPPECLSPP